MLKRFFHILLSIYIVSLTILPCVDDGHGDTCDKTEITANNSQSEHQDIDHCSPFCDCCCCGIPMTTGISPFSIQISAIVVEIQAFYHSTMPATYYNSPWHPPKQA